MSKKQTQISFKFNGPYDLNPFFDLFYATLGFIFASAIRSVGITAIMPLIFAVVIDSQVLLSDRDMAALEHAFREMGSEGEALFQPTIDAIRKSMNAGIKSIFWFGAVTMLLSFLLILTIPEIPIGSTEEKPE